MGTFMLNAHNANVPVATQKKPIKRERKRNLEAKVDTLYK